MARAKTEKTVDARNYTYGAREPIEGIDIFWVEVRAQNRYRNALVELELRRRDSYAAARRAHCPGVLMIESDEAQLLAVMASTLEAIKSANKGARRNAATPAQKQALADAKANLRDCRARLKVAKAEAKVCAPLVAESKAIQDQFYTDQKRLRAASGLYWGNYLQVEEAAEAFGKGAPPKFRGMRGDGKISVQIQHGITLAEAFACSDQRLRIEIVPSNTGDSNRARKYMRAIVWIRIGSQGKRRQPIWCKVPAIFHRPMPEGCSIKWAFLHAKRVGTKTKWEVRFALTTPQGALKKQGLATAEVVGIDVGWRKLDDSLRIAYWVGSDGQHGELSLPFDDVGRWDHADSLRAIRDRMFDQIKVTLREWLATTGCPAPDWLRTRFATLPAWRACARLATTLIGWHTPEGPQAGWRYRRFDGDADIYDAVEEWRKQDKHLYDWECAEREKAIAWRTDTYRKWAIRMARQYQTAIIEDTKWTDLAKLPEAESDEPIIARARYLNRVASPGRLLEIVRAAFDRHFRVPAQHTTSTCHSCGNQESFDAIVEIEHTCSACGLIWDQDKNAAHNLLAAGQSLVASSEMVNETPGPARESEDEDE